MKTTIKTALSSCKEEAQSIMSYIMKGLDDAKISYETNKKQTEIIVADSTKKKIQGIVDTVDMANSKLRLVAVTESKSKKKVYIRLKFI